MQSLKHKIKDTALFSNIDKIAILTQMDTYSEDDLTSLEKIIGEFDAQYNKGIQNYKQSVAQKLDSIVANVSGTNKQRVQSSVNQIKTGVDQILSAKL